MKLSDDQLRASYEIYKTRGNSSGAMVLIVLDKLRRMSEGRDNVVACAFGPGLATEMAMFKRCREPVVGTWSLTLMAH
jgi:type III polyketide synthase